MAREPMTPSQKRYQRRSWLIALIAAAVFVTAVVALDPVLHRPKRGDDILAMLAGFLMMQMAVIITVSYFFAAKEMPRQRMLQVLTPVTTGVALFLPMAGQDLIDPRVNFAIVVALTAASFWFIWRIWRTSDELYRSLTKDSYVVSYFVLVIALWIYAAGERLGLFGGVTAWGGLAFATLISFPCTIWVAVRRGLNRPPKDE